MPAQQVRRRMTEIGPDPGREFLPVGTRYGTKVEIDVDARGGARPGPSV
ncbi:hypothetical protein ACFXKS_04765 [Streptomyces scopuliridis]